MLLMELHDPMNGRGESHVRHVPVVGVMFLYPVINHEASTNLGDKVYVPWAVKALPSSVFTLLSSLTNASQQTRREHIIAYM
jgi:hypothetical protein